MTKLTDDVSKGELLLYEEELLNQRLFVLGSDNYETFVSMLDNPPAPGPKLTALMCRVPAWRKK
ncbi:MAG: DUF1778 domain-containing protein [Polyangiaceae bacterium]|nr:DUF1778 domain-containing protein [Polyangiaceae bacterium]